LVLASDPVDGVSVANEHAKVSRAEMSQSAHHRATTIVAEEQATLARQ
jgi:hypothetical protein